MKLRIIDLMDYYQGNPSVPLMPYRKTAVHRAGEFRNEEKRAKAGRIKQGMMAAACLVMIVALTAFSLWVSPLLQRWRPSGIPCPPAMTQQRLQTKPLLR